VENELIESLGAAVQAAPSDIALRLHLAGLLVDAGRRDEAIQHIATVLVQDSANEQARTLIARATGVPPATPASADPAASEGPTGFNWSEAESQVEDIVAPMFVEGGDAVPTEQAFDVEPSRLRLSDVGGVDEVKKRLEASFLAPLRNPELRRVYGKSIRGGLLLYGPPGCGKTYIAKAIAGELEASFLSVSLSEILDMFIGNSEKNVTELFERARASAPCVLFLDELDAIGQKRTLTRHSGMRGTVNQLLTELDGVSSSNEGVYVLAATNQPWDVDEALRRPGRLDRTLLVRPPDDRARQEIFRLHLKERPVEQIDLGRLARKTDGYSGADIAHICDTAAEIALLDSVATGQVRTIRMDDLDAAISDVRPSIGPWLESARNVALFANQDGDYDELAAFLRKRKRR
jgi:SpoVK/Ycf46/Vps4 family AAA+-type ATPase